MMPESLQHCFLGVSSRKLKVLSPSINCIALNELHGIGADALTHISDVGSPSRCVGEQVYNPNSGAGGREFWPKSKHIPVMSTPWAIIVRLRLESRLYEY